MSSAVPIKTRPSNSDQLAKAAAALFGALFGVIVMAILLQNGANQSADSSPTEAALRRKVEDAFNKMTALEHLTAAEGMLGPDTSHDALASVQKHLAAIDSQAPEAKRASALKKRADVRLRQLEKEEQQRAAKQPPEVVPQGVAIDPKDSLSRSLLEYLYTDFGHTGAETSWFSHIKGVHVQEETARITTDLTSRGESASGICRAVSGFVYASGNTRLGLQHVEIVGMNERILVFRFGISGKCE